ncbi:MAG: glycoside hydrolase family 2 protein [Anaerolineae bacterium]|nr:glycoside hydrolase family 2 protein [Anaerolineae bacterium]
MRKLHNFNQGWLFAPEEIDITAPDEAFQPITLPHSNKTFSQRYVINTDYQFVSTYRKHFTLSEDLNGKRIFLEFDGVLLESSVYLNGELCGRHQGGYTPFSFEITRLIESGDNVLTVYVDSTEHKHIPPYGNLVDYLTFGGIYRDAHLLIVDQTHIIEVIATPENVLHQPQLNCAIQLSQWQPDLELVVYLSDEQDNVIATHTQILDNDNFHFTISDLVDIRLWSLDCPAIYKLHLTLKYHGAEIDCLTSHIGFREAHFSDDGSFYLNGKTIKLMGLNRHQTYPFIGAAGPKRLQAMDADILKYELGCNIVRTSHYPQSPHFLDRCDEIGLLVFEEIAGWQHIGDEAWQGLVLDSLRAMIKRDRHHPSIILWGVRINESRDNEAFYIRTNDLAHELDTSRQTGGVRNFWESQRLEDVFTLNDFTEGIQKPRPPHLITEFAGHMFPTKTSDHEARRVEHALKHARKHNLQFGNKDVAGAIGWCAFDYHTHKEFGSGDRICHHGVMDMFRLPKYAAYFYRSQKSPNDEVVLFAATSWTIGDRDGGGNNPMVIFSNCDRIEILVGDTSFGYLEPDYASYPHLPHPPFTFRWPEPFNPWGLGFEDLIVRGFINDERVKEHRVSSDHIPNKLHLSSYYDRLHADGVDMTRITAQVHDKYGNVLPHRPEVIQWSLEGDAQFIGENPMALIGGQGACFIRAGHTPGKVRITASSALFGPVSKEIVIED